MAPPCPPSLSLLLPLEDVTPFLDGPFTGTYGHMTSFFLSFERQQVGIDLFSSRFVRCLAFWGSSCFGGLCQYLILSVHTERQVLLNFIRYLIKGNRLGCFRQCCDCRHDSLNRPHGILVKFPPPHTPEDIVNGNHKQLRDRKGNAAHQQTTTFIYDNSHGDSPKDRPRNIQNLGKLILPI